MSLIEVMVSVLVLAVGLLGVAAMQSLALRGGQGSLESTQAVMATSSILESIRANRAQADAYNMAKICSGTVTASDALAQSDKNAWLTSLKTTIGSGVSDTTTCGQIACNAGVCTVTVFWNDIRAGADQGGAARNLQTSARI